MIRAVRLGALLAVLVLWVGDLARAAAREDKFSALTSVARALAPERRLLALLRSYLLGEEARLRDLTRFYDKVLSLHEDSATPVANPLLAFTLIKRLHSDWRNVVHSLEASENIRALKDGYEKLEQELPAFEDLEGAARALMRLQDVYMLNVKGLARGVFQRVTGSAVTDLYSPRQLFSLTADDCFQIGKVAYDMGDYYHAIPWLEEAVSLFRGSYGEWKTEDEASLEDALDHLAFACFQLQRSVVASGGKQLQVEYRISKSAWLKDTVDPMLVTLNHRIAALTGLDVRPPYAEYLQVVNYGIGGHYEPHFDHATSPSSPLFRMKSGNRVATFMIYEI